MSGEQKQSSPQLGWRFWLVMLAPTLVALSAPLFSRPGNMGGGLPLLYIAIGLNFYCSNWAAKQIILRHDPRGGSSPWMFLWGPLIFFLNVALVCGGCALMMQGSR